MNEFWITQFPQREFNSSLEKWGWVKVWIKYLGLKVELGWVRFIVF